MGALAEKLSGGDGGGGGGDVDDEDLVDPSLASSAPKDNVHASTQSQQGKSKRGRGVYRHKAHTIFRVTLLGPPESGKTALATQVRRGAVGEGKRRVCVLLCGEERGRGETPCVCDAVWCCVMLCGAVWCCVLLWL